MRLARRALDLARSAARLRHRLKTWPVLVIVYGAIWIVYEVAFAAWFMAPVVEDIWEDVVEVLDGLP